MRVRAGFLEFQRYRVEPLTATLTLEPERARLEATQAALCGIAFPFTAEITPHAMGVSGLLEAKSQQLAATARWVKGSDAALKTFTDFNRANLAKDRDGDPVFMAKSSWDVGYQAEKNPDLVFSATKER